MRFLYRTVIIEFCAHITHRSGKLRVDVAMTWFSPDISMVVKWSLLYIESVCFRERCSTHAVTSGIDVDRHGWSLVAASVIYCRSAGDVPGRSCCVMSNVEGISETTR